MDNDSTSSSSSNSLIEDKAIISKILGEMKCQFNHQTENSNQSTSDNTKDEDLNPEEIVKIESENSKDSSDSTNTDEQPRIVMCFRKPNDNRRSKRANRVNNEFSLKRSTRRSSKDCRESVLQTAIARKEKSYNETIKPQRLSRQLKPTQKILENIATAAAKKKGKSNKNVKHSKRNHKRELMEVSEVDVKIRRSDRFHSQNVDDEKTDCKVEVKEEEDEGKFAMDVDLNSATAQLIASRLCVCSHQTQIYALPTNNESNYCTAIDSIGKKIIGCNNLVNCEEMCMLRPSTRVPFISLCKIHRNRMLRHNCCPTCGIFCTQGQFSQCTNRHQYHRKCQITVGDFECCPHCGSPTPKTDVYVKMETSTPPVFSPTQGKMLSVQRY